MVSRLKLYDIASLWIGPELSWMEQLCLESYLNHGHRTILYSYDHVKSVPSGVEMRDAREIMPTEEIIYHKKTGSPAFHSDIFRLRMLSQTDFLWVDTDAYCLKPFQRPDHGYFFGWGSDEGRKLYTGVLGLPKTSAALQRMLHSVEDHYPIPPWFNRTQQQALRDLHAKGTPQHFSEMKWGVFGPDALTWTTRKTDEQKYAFEGHVLYPVPYSATNYFHRPKHLRRTLATFAEETLSVHFYGRRFRNIFAMTEGLPMPGSYADMLCKEHGIDPAETAHLFVK